MFFLGGGIGEVPLGCHDIWCETFFTRWYWTVASWPTWLSKCSAAKYRYDDTHLGGSQNKFDLHGVIIILMYLLQTNLMFLCFSSQTMRRQTPAVGGSCAKHCRPEAPRRGQHGGQTFRRSYGLSCKPKKWRTLANEASDSQKSPAVFLEKRWQKTLKSRPFPRVFSLVFKSYWQRWILRAWWCLHTFAFQGRHQWTAG